MRERRKITGLRMGIKLETAGFGCKLNYRSDERMSAFETHRDRIQAMFGTSVLNEVSELCKGDQGFSVADSLQIALPCP